MTGAVWTLLKARRRRKKRRNPYFSFSSSSPQAPVQKWSGTGWARHRNVHGPCHDPWYHDPVLLPASLSSARCQPSLWQTKLRISMCENRVPRADFCPTASMMNSLLFGFPADNIGCEGFLQNKNRIFVRFQQWLWAKISRLHAITNTALRRVIWK